METTTIHPKRRPSRFASAALLFAAAALANTASAQCGPGWVRTPGLGFAGVNGTVFASIMWDPDGGGPEPEWLVIGGMFSAAGDIAANSVAAFDGQAWHGLAGGVTEGFIFDRVSAFEIYDGMLIVGGHFAQAGGLPVENIAAFDGADWHALGAGIYGGFSEPEVSAMAVHDGQLIAAGAFTSAGEGPANFIARWNGTEWAPLGAGASFVVQAAETHDGDLYIGGQFQSVGGGIPGTNLLARWDGLGWSSVGGGVPNGTSVFGLHSDGADLYVGGQFGVIGTLVTPGVARWDGTAFRALGSGIPGLVTSFSEFDGQLHVGGHFTIAGGTTANRVARWDGVQWDNLGQGVNDTVWTLTDAGDELFVGGRFREAGGQTARGIASWDGGDWTSVEGTPLGVMAGGLAVFEDTLIISGYADLSFGNHLGAVVRFDGLEFAPMGESFNELPWDIGVHDGDLYAVGWFTQVGASNAAGVARWDGAAWQDIGAQLTGGYVTSGLSIGSYDGDLIIGGDFTQAGGVPANHIARYDGADWHAMGDGLGDDYSFIWDLVEYNGDLVAVGYFPEFNHVARWDGTQWSALGTGLSGGTLPEALAATVFEGDLIVAGEFALAGGAPAFNVARWDGSQWLAMDTGAPGHGVASLAVYNGNLYAGANFFFSDDPSLRLVMWNGSAWEPVGGGLDGSIGDFQVFKSELVLAGGFATAGGAAAPGLARWNDTGTPWFARQPLDNERCLGVDAFFIALLASGYEDATVRWRHDGVPLTDGPTGYGSIIGGADNEGMTVANPHAPDAGVYDLVADIGCAVAVSEPALLSICIADFDCSGAVNTLDVLAFLNAWGAGDSHADLDGDGQVNTLDVLAFLNTWTGGC